MRRTTRLFEIIQRLRAARRPMTAAVLAAEFEVTQRTIYRDIASLQATAVPILGEAGIGYVMRPGYDLPPLMLTVEEIEAVTVALGLLARTGDKGLKDAARSVEGKIAAVLPDVSRSAAALPSLYASNWGAAEPDHVDLALVRAAIRDERKLKIIYRDDFGAGTERTVRPIAVIYYVEVIIIVAWCELRAAFRQFRADRVLDCAALDDRFLAEGAGLRKAWSAERQSAPPAPLIDRPRPPHHPSPGQSGTPLLSPADDHA